MANRKKVQNVDNAEDKKKVEEWIGEDGETMLLEVSEGENEVMDEEAKTYAVPIVHLPTTDFKWYNIVSDDSREKAAQDIEAMVQRGYFPIAHGNMGSLLYMLFMLKVELPGNIEWRLSTS